VPFRAGRLIPRRGFKWPHHLSSSRISASKPSSWRINPAGCSGLPIRLHGQLGMRSHDQTRSSRRPCVKRWHDSFPNCHTATSLGLLLPILRHWQPGAQLHWPELPDRYPVRSGNWAVRRPRRRPRPEGHLMRLRGNVLLWIRHPIASCSWPRKVRGRAIWFSGALLSRAGVASGDDHDGYPYRARMREPLQGARKVKSTAYPRIAISLAIFASGC